METALATVIIGLMAVGVMGLLATGTMATADSTEMTVAVNLALNAEELLQTATYSTLLATYDGQTYSPPKDARGTALGSFSDWTQSIDVQYVNPASLSTAVADTPVQDTARVTVTVKHNSRAIYTTSWIAVAP